LFELAQQHGLSGKYVELTKHVAVPAERAMGKPGQLPHQCHRGDWCLVVGAGHSLEIVSWFGRDWAHDWHRGHLAEELRNPLAREIWERTEEECSAHVRT
jgi:citrate synthase